MVAGFANEDERGEVEKVALQTPGSEHPRCKRGRDGGRLNQQEKKA